MKYRVKLKTTVTAWAEVEINDALAAHGPDPREWAADDAVDLHGWVLAEPLKAAGLEHGPIELAHEELDESVEALP